MAIRLFVAEPTNRGGRGRSTAKCADQRFGSRRAIRFDSVFGQALKAAKKWRLFLETAFRYGYSGVFAGPVNTGKTHNMRAFFHAIPLYRRILTVQDTEELFDMPQPDVVHFLYPKDTGGVAQHTAQGCIEAALRMDMDEIVNGEV